MGLVHQPFFRHTYAVFTKLLTFASLFSYLGFAIVEGKTETPVDFSELKQEWGFIFSSRSKIKAFSTVCLMGTVLVVY